MNVQAARSVSGASSSKAGLPVWRALARLWEVASIYLPVVLMGVLALATYWMVQRTPVFVEPNPASKAQVHEVDFFMRGAVIRSYGQDGRLINQLRGQEIRHYGDDKTLEVDRPLFWSKDELGRVVTATAQHGWVRDDGSLLKLQGDAVVIREPWKDPEGKWVPRQEMRGEFLIVDSQQESLESPQPAEIFSGQDRFSGDTLTYDRKTGVAEFKGRVRATLVPR